jgi:hypothetical protein
MNKKKTQDEKHLRKLIVEECCNLSFFIYNGLD